MFITSGFDGFISKPVDISDFERVLKQLIPSSIKNYRVAEEEQS